MPLIDDFDESKLFSQHAVKTPSLSGYYRVPGLHVVTPSRGKFLKEFQPTMSNEMEVFPMKASDEMLLKNPDSLMSGAALENLFGSCIPSIKNPREISMPDIDVLLIAIRAATYGEKMLLDVTCPSCKEEYEYTCHLPSFLSTMTYVDESPAVQLTDEIIVTVRPYTLYDASKIALLAFEESRNLQNMDANTSDDELGRKIRMSKMNESMARVNELNELILANSISSVLVPEGVVEDKKEIVGFIRNVSKAWREQIENRIQDMNNHGIDKKMHIECPKCKHEWDTHLEIDPTSFFDASS